MLDRLNALLQRLSWRIHGFVLGMSLTWGALLVGQNCAAGGQ